MTPSSVTPEEFAIVALADETATCAAMRETTPSGTFRPDLFPLTLQLSVNLIRNVSETSVGGP